MNINVPKWARTHFWEDPPDDAWEFWAFCFKPPCAVGDELAFRFDGVIVAKAIVAKIEPPGQSKCEATGRFRALWKVYWRPESFQEIAEA